MDFGELHLEDRGIRFVVGGKEHFAAYKELVWAYPASGGIVVHTRQKERYPIEMDAEEAERCLKTLKKQNPELITDSQKGGKLPLNSLDNTRDLGSMRTQDGCLILPGRLLRSGDLYHISYDDQKYLRREYKLKTVIDFRTEKEWIQRPDEMLEGAERIEHPILEENLTAMESLIHFSGDGEASMLRFYEDLVLDRRAQSAYGSFLRILKHRSEGAVLWHGSAGKDRTGVGTALLLRVLGVPETEVLADYMQTKDYLQKDTEFMLLMLENRGVPRRVLKNAEIMLDVKERYLQRAFDKITEKYGTFDKYVKKALGLTPFDRNFLRDRYLF